MTPRRRKSDYRTVGNRKLARIADEGEWTPVTTNWWMWTLAILFVVVELAIVAAVVWRFVR